MRGTCPVAFNLIRAILLCMPGALVAMPAWSACPPETSRGVLSPSAPTPTHWQSEPRVSKPDVPGVRREPDGHRHNPRGGRNTIYVVLLYNVGIA